MRIALIGAAGQLGSDLSRVLDGMVPLTRENCDVTRPEYVDSALSSVRPDLVINTAAYNLVDQSEDEPDRAFVVNAFAVRDLARWCERNGAALLHVSSDYVFGLAAGRSTPYLEEEAPGPVNVYGASKLAGEYFARAECRRSFVVRTCGLYGHSATRAKGNFVETMLRLAQTREELRVVDDQLCTPTFTRDLAFVIARLIETGEYGVYHATNSGAMTWCEFAREIFRRQNLPTRVTPISTAEFGARARRPAYSVLNCGKIQRTTGVDLPDWREALTDYLAGRP